jgi:hypothetical protein
MVVPKGGWDAYRARAHTASTNGRSSNSRLPEGNSGNPQAAHEDGQFRRFRRFFSHQGEKWLVGRVFLYLADYLILSEASLLAISAWVVAAWLAKVWDRFPHLGITSPRPRCGKTRLLELLQQICPNAKLTVSISPPALFRKIRVEMPTLLHDEAQSLSRGGSEAAEALREIFCGGISKKATVSRCVGQNHIPTDFPIYCPKAVALIGKLDGTLADRSLPIQMKRKKEGEEVKRFRMRVIEGDGATVSADLKKWAECETTKKHAKKLYDQLEPFDIDNDRMAELLLPLQTVLIMEGGEDDDTNLPLGELRRYAEDLEKLVAEIERQSPAVRLLAACKDILTSKIYFIRTQELIQQLVALPEEEWNTYSHGMPITERALAILLEDYDIKPRRDNRQQRGYCRHHFLDAWARYIPEDPRQT